MSTHTSTSAFIPPSQVEIGKDFTDRSTISSSGFSLVVRAKRQGRWWILKGLKEEYRNLTAYQLLLRKEYELMASLSHPHVATVVGMEMVEGIGLSIVMEWIDGKTLSLWLAEDNHSRKQRMRIARQIMDALSYVHSRQIVHRDLKPSNIMITANGEDVKLIDFGISDADSYALFKQPAGTDGYVSPEQREGGKPDLRNDIYSLGCLLRDLHLGIVCRPIVSRCLKPIDKRYRNVEEVRTALDRSRIIPYYILLCVAAMGILVVVGIAKRQATVNPVIEKESPKNVEITPTKTKTDTPLTKEEKTTTKPILPAKTNAKPKTTDNGSKEEAWLKKNLVTFNSKDSARLNLQDCEVINTAIRFSLPKLKSSMEKYSKEASAISSFDEYKELKERITSDMDSVIKDCASQYADKGHTPEASGIIRTLIRQRLRLYLYHFYLTPMFQELTTNNN